jgi:hypothetical protein
MENRIENRERRAAEKNDFSCIELMNVVYKTKFIYIKS